MPKYKSHGERELKVLDLSDDFCRDTFKILKDEKIFPKSSRWLGVYEIANLLNDMHTKLLKANNIKVTNAVEWDIRHSLQSEAYADIITIGEKFTFMSAVFEMKIDKLNKWLESKGKLQGYISAWKLSDEKRYKEKIG